MGGARGQDAQAERARRRAERRLIKRQETEVKAEERRVNEAVDQLVADFSAAFRETIRLAVGERLRRIKAERDRLRDATGAARRLAEARQAELVGQVSRARTAEAEVTSLRERLAQVQREVEARRDAEVRRHAQQLLERDQLIEEQEGTIRAQATALREANLRAKG